MIHSKVTLLKTLELILIMVSAACPNLQAENASWSIVGDWHYTGDSHNNPHSMHLSFHENGLVTFTQNETDVVYEGSYLLQEGMIYFGSDTNAPLSFPIWCTEDYIALHGDPLLFFQRMNFQGNAEKYRQLLRKNGITFNRLLVTLDGQCVVNMPLHKDVNLQGLTGVPINRLTFTHPLPLQLDVSEDASWMELPPIQVPDISPLRKLPLTELSLDKTSLADLSGLNGLPLISLTLEQTPVSDLSPLYGMPLQVLNLRETAVADLVPLTGMPLRELDLSGTNVTDVTPLAGMPLEYVDISDTSVTDISPLRNAPLHAITFSPGRIQKGMEELRMLNTLTQIRIVMKHTRLWYTAKDFWKQFDEGDIQKYVEQYDK